MFRDLGFIWYLAKDVIKVIAFIGWIAATGLMERVPAPWDWVCFAISVTGFIIVMVYFLGPLLKETMDRKYREYRAKKEAAWDILKESK